MLSSSVPSLAGHARLTLCALLFLFAFAFSATAQTIAPPKRLGVLAGFVCPTPDAPAYWGPMLHHLADRGWIEGQNLVVDCVAAGGHAHELAPSLALELVARRPDVLLGASTVTVRALMEATTTIPIVTAGSDALRNHIVNDLAHPDANVTGVSPMIFDLTAKRMELLKDTLPRLSRVAIILHKGVGGNDLELIETDIGAGAKKLRFTSQKFYPADLEDVGRIFAQLAAEGFDAAYIFSTPFSFGNRRQIAQIALQYRVPTISDNTEFAKDGVLLTYGVEVGSLIGDTAEYIDKLLRGAKPADLPLRQPTKFEMAINLKTAKALGLDIPQSIIIRADKVIE